MNPSPARHHPMPNPSKQPTSTAPAQVSAEASFREFLDKHPCGDQIRRSVQEQGLAEVTLVAEPAPSRPPRLR